jgi:hypothetical protein
MAHIAGGPRTDLPYDPAALDRLIADFAARFGSFANPTYVELEPHYKRLLAADVRGRLSRDVMDAWIGGGQFDAAKAEIKRCLGRTYAGQQNNLLNQFDQRAIHDAPAEPLTRALHELLYGEAFFLTRWGAWVRTLTPQKSDCWPAATYFPMLVWPEQHIFIKAAPLGKLLRALNSPIRWDTAPSAGKYAELQRLARALLAALQPLGARDMIDVQSWIWILFPSKP